MACECDSDLGMSDMSEVESESDVESDDTTSVTFAEQTYGKNYVDYNSVFILARYLQVNIYIHI